MAPTIVATPDPDEHPAERPWPTRLLDAAAAADRLAELVADLTRLPLLPGGDAR